MSNNFENDKHIQDELKRLEVEVELANKTNQPIQPTNKSLGHIESVSKSDEIVKSDSQLFAGIGLFVIGLIMLFQHIKVGTGALAFLGIGSGGFGFILLPLLVSIGWVFYNPKNKFAWGLGALSLIMIFVSVLSSIIMYFPTMSLLASITMLVPLILGISLIVKGIGGPKAISQNLSQLKNNSK